MLPTKIMRLARRVLPPAVLATVVACGTTPKDAGMAPAPGAGPAPTPSTRYYKDDGPGDNVPANMDAIPDAIPRPEALHRFANRPYTVLGRDYVPATVLRPYRERGIASWYGRKFHGEKTSTGETYDMYAMTAAHPTLPLPSYARVTNVASGKSVVVRVNDRGPFLHGRVIDLSFAAASRIGIAQGGSGEVEVEAILPSASPTLVAVAPLPPVTPPAERRSSRTRARGATCRRSRRDPGRRVRRTTRGLCKFCQCAEFRRARREPNRAARGRTERSPGQRLFRVFIGPYRARDDAKRMATACATHWESPPPLPSIEARCHRPSTVLR